jgi:hypothetical protein
MSSQTKSITITYALNSPVDTRKETNLNPTKSQTFQFESDNNYYSGLRRAIATAKEETGKELTEWRDAVGDLEKGKDEKKPSENEDSGDEDEQEE